VIRQVPKPHPDRAHTLSWALFGAGGMVAALLLPVHILIQGILGPLGIVPVVDHQYETFARALSNPLVKLYIIVLVALPMWHWAHRFQFWLHHIGVHVGRRVLPPLMYGIAVAVSAVAVYLVLTTP
jgi:fumarate reductase subunit D